MLESISNDVLRAIMTAIDDTVIDYATLPQVCTTLRRSILSNPPRTLNLPGDIPWAALAASPTRQNALVTWFSIHAHHIHTMAIHLAASNHNGLTLHPAHRSLAMTADPWGSILPGLSQLKSLTLGSVHVNLLPAIACCTTLTELRLRVVGPCEPSALTAGLDRLGCLSTLEHLEVNATRWALQRRHIHATGVPVPPGAGPSVADAATTPRGDGVLHASPRGDVATQAVAPHNHMTATQSDVELPSTSLLVPVTVVEAVRDEAAAELLWAARHRPVRYPVTMLPMTGQLRCLRLHIGPRTLLPASLSRLQGLQCLVICSMARPEFPTAALDVTTLTELEYSCEWVPRGGFDTVMHLLAPPFVLPANLKEKLPKLARLVLRGCELGQSASLQAQAEAMGVPHVDVGPPEDGTALLQRSLLLVPAVQRST